MMIKGELEKKMKKMIIISSVIVVLLLTMSIFLRIYLNHIVRNNMICLLYTSDAADEL